MSAYNAHNAQADFERATVANSKSFYFCVCFKAPGIISVFLINHEQSVFNGFFMGKSFENLIDA